MTYLDRLALVLFTLLALPIAIVPVAFPIAVLSAATGIAIAPWVATVAALPLAYRIARGAMELI